MSVTITTLTPGIRLSPVLGSVDFSLVEIGWLRVNPPLIHVELVDLDWVPVVEVPSRMGQCGFVRGVVWGHTVNVVWWVTDCRSGFEVRTRALAVIELYVKRYVIVCVVQLFGCLLEPEIRASLKFFPQHFVFPRQFINLQIFLFQFLVIDLKLFPQLLVPF